MTNDDDDDEEMEEDGRIERQAAPVDTLRRTVLGSIYLCFLREESLTHLQFNIIK